MMFMKRTAIKKIFKIIISLAGFIVVYTFGKNTGYEKGWTDGNMAGVCKRCVYHDDELEDCSDIPDFKGIYS